MKRWQWLTLAGLFLLTGIPLALAQFQAPISGGGGGGTGGGGTGTPGGATNSIQYNAGGGNFGGTGMTDAQILLGQTSGNPLGKTLSGDATITDLGTITVTKTNGTAFGTFATQNFATPPAIGGTTPAAGSFTTLTATGSVTLSGLGAGTQVSCLGLTSANVVVPLTGQCGTGSGSGTVTSVGLALPNIFSVTGTPVTTTGTLTGTLATQAANALFAGPTSGSAAAPTFRAMVSADIPSGAVTYAKIQNETSSTLLGNPTGGAAAPSEISLANGLTFSGTTLGVSTPINTSTSSYTISATDMGGQRNYNGTNITSTIPAITSTVFALGMSSVITNYNATPLTISTTPTINGIPSSSLMHQFGWAACTSNSTSLDCFGFPGFGTITSNALPKTIDATGATTASSLVDDGTTVRSGEPVSVEQNQSYALEIPNDASTGTTVNKLAKLTSAGAAIIASTTDTDGEIGVVIGAAGKSGNAQIAVSGTAGCVFDGATTAGDFVGISSSTAGDCHDAGATRPLSAQTIGRVLSTNASGGTYEVTMALGVTNTAGGGSGTVNSGTAGQMAYYATSTTAVSGNANATISGGALTLGVSTSALGSLILSGNTSGAVSILPQAAAGTYNFNLPTSAGSSGQPLLSGGGGSSPQTYDANASFSAGALSLGASGTAGSVTYGNATSGTITVQPVTGALGTVTASLPANTGTIAETNLKQSWTAAQRGTPTNITISTATFTPNFDTAQNFEIDLTSACPCTLANPSTTLVAGQSGMIEIHQDATGSRIIGTWGADYQYAGGTSTITLSTAANAVDYLPYYVNNAATGIVLGTILKAPAH